jgi:hypothetical protein
MEHQLIAREALRLLSQTGVEQRLEQRPANGAIEGVGLGCHLQVWQRIEQPTGTSQRAAQSPSAGSQVRLCQGRFVEVDQLAGEVGQKGVQPPAQQSDLGLNLVLRMAGLLPGGVLPGHAEVVEGERIVRLIQRCQCEPHRGQHTQQSACSFRGQLFLRQRGKQLHQVQRRHQVR